MSRLESEDMRAMRQVASDVLAKAASSARVREVMNQHGAPDAALISQIAQLGWFGLEIAEEFGGIELGLAELELVLEEVGATAASDVLTSSAVLAAGAIALGGTATQQERWLPTLASGEQLGTLVLGGLYGPTGGAVETLTAQRSADGWTFNGLTSYVLNARVSQLMVVAAQTETDWVVAVMPTDTRGVKVSARAMMDESRCLDDVRFDGVAVADADVLTDDPVDADELIEAIVNRAAVAMAADAVGNARRLLDMTVTYAGQREQFGRAIGSFQAVKHQAANMLVELETSSELVGSAAAIVGRSPSGSQAAVAASMAKEYACERGAFSAGVALQLHGGIGYTWEHDLHIFFKRAKLSEQLFGTGRWHRERIAAALLGP